MADGQKQKEERGELMGKMKDLAIEQRNKALSGGGELLISDEEAARIARAAFRHNELFDQIENAVSTQHAPHLSLIHI